MDTKKMKRINFLDSKKARNMIYDTIRIKEELFELEEVLYQDFLYNQIKEVVETCYDLGEVREIYEIFGGYINRSFGIYTEKNGVRCQWFVRKYMKHKDMNELLLEHHLLQYAHEKGFHYSATPIDGVNGRSYQEVSQYVDGEELPFYFAVYNYIEGTDQYNWIKNDLPQESYLAAARIIADFHCSVNDFDPQGWQRDELPILELLQQLPDIFQGYVEKAHAQHMDTAYTCYFTAQLPYVSRMCRTVQIPEDQKQGLPVNPIQCDFHPGNLRYDLNGIPVGIFDFDWSKVDLRVFELGLGMVYFFSSWDVENDGELDLEKIKSFLKEYDRIVKEHHCGLPPLTSAEKDYFPEMLVAGNEYLVLWGSRAYFQDPSLNPYEYLYYLQHQIRCLRFTEEHLEELRRMAREL